MRLLPKHLRGQLGRLRTRRARQDTDHPPPTDSSPLDDMQEVAPLVTLARSFRKAPPLQVDERFADRLEELLLASTARQAQISQIKEQERKERRFWIASIGLLATPRARGVVMACSLLVLCLGAGLMVMRGLPPSQSQTTRSTSTIKQVQLTDQAAHTQLNLLTSLANPEHAQTYRAELTKLEQQIYDCAQEAATVPTRSEWDQAEQELTDLKADARQVLYQLLSGLALPERVLTTTELGNLGAAVPVLRTVELSLTPTHTQATIHLLGSGILPGARLLIDDLMLTVNGVWQNGWYDITIPWSMSRPQPHSLGLLNMDNTATQTVTFAIEIEQGNDDRGKNSGSGSSGRDGDGDGSSGGGGSGSGSGSSGSGKGSGSGGSGSGRGGPG